MIKSFSGSYRFLSNFEECNVYYEGQAYRSVEHAYVAAKTTDLLIRKEIQALPTSGKVKRYGRKLELRRGWDNLKYSIMFDLVEQKFYEEPYKSLLLATKGDIFEGNSWGDKYWGVVWNEDGSYDGLNHLGEIIMNIRHDLLLENKPSPIDQLNFVKNVLDFCYQLCGD